MASPRLQSGRISQCGACYSVTIVVRDRRPMLSLRHNAGIVVDELRRLASKNTVTHIAWVLMPDHVHWLFRLNNGSLSRCVQALKARSARAIHQYENETGPLWQAGYYDHRLRDERDLHAQARYLVENPLRKGLVERVEDYPFWWCRWITGSADLL
ncbi:transposase [Pseudoxanthomonas helianthi]|uniref:Transposase n=1 Tax=Pseudoxanthomonas helianthi TaxID=1453541 RepID=A0A940X1R6_9GAMM|nr:transposase [Pseudoxanthomonas helianthi]MBP3983772.1 transposase [Pseudoxanthomonas helianthi]